MAITSFYQQVKKSGLKFIFWEISWTIKYLSLRKLLNFLKNFYQKKFVFPSKVNTFPIKLTIDPSANCMLACPLCPTGNKDKGRARGEMSFDNLKKLINEVGDYLFEIDLFNWGEPFLNKDIFKMISFADSKKIITRLSSNLNFFPVGYEKKLIESKLNHLVVSLDGITQQTYSQYRRGGDMDKVLKAVSKIAKEKEKQKSKTPFITWQFIVFDHNEHEIPKAKKLVKKLGFDRIVFIKNRGNMASELFGKKKRKNQTCKFLWDQAVVNWNGSVSPCCLYYDQKYDFGNVFTDGFMVVWNNQKYQMARKMITSKKITPATKALICSNCLINGFPD